MIRWPRSARLRKALPIPGPTDHPAATRPPR
jgi:hypothetical protein